jgi:protein O-GlcNAc transferase
MWNVMGKAGRNDPCPCGSGKKYKQCCLPNEQAGQKAALQEIALAHFNRGNALKSHKHLDAALASFDQAIAFDPGYAAAYFNRGNTLNLLKRWDAALTSFDQFIALEPESADGADGYINRGATLLELKQLDGALKSFNKAIAINPDHVVAYNNCGKVFADRGNFDEAIKHFNKALSIKPDFAEARNNLLFVYGYHSLLGPHEYLAQARLWEQTSLPEQDRERARDRVFHRPPLAGRRLKVGYVSGDYRQHAMSYFIEQLFARHDRSRVELFAYTNNEMRDAVTERLQALADHWIHITEMDDTAVLDRVGQDKIDVLVDLSGHTGHNRLKVFAHRAAPVQVHYLGYFASTGLTEMDYMIGDDILTPPETDSHFCEKIWRLPRVRASYEGGVDAPEPDWRPADDGSVWVGSFNNLSKLTPATLALWARVLHALPEGRLLLKTKDLADAGTRRRILDAMGKHGIAQERIELQDRSATPGWREHMAYYNRLDIVLDSMGAHGGYTTACDALWMGAPVIAIEGDRMATRMAASILHAIGHPEWIAGTEAEYVEKVVALARDEEQRKTLRSSQRERMASSALCDAKGLSTSLENAYFEMFERWTDKQNGQ